MKKKNLRAYTLQFDIDHFERIKKLRSKIGYKAMLIKDNRLLMTNSLLLKEALLNYENYLKVLYENERAKPFIN